MPPIEKPTHEKYDYIIIGGGSAGSGGSVSGLLPILFTGVNPDHSVGQLRMAKRLPS